MVGRVSGDEIRIAPGVPLIPPDWFVTRFKLGSPDGPFRSALDPLVMLAWHTVNEERPFTAGLPAVLRACARVCGGASWGG